VRCDQDIALCTIAIAHAGDRLSHGFRLALTLLGGVRRWVFLPALVGLVPVLVLYKGGDALSVCFNTIAILFLTEVTMSKVHFTISACHTETVQFPIQMVVNS
jgi:hypothetical protein